MQRPRVLVVEDRPGVLEVMTAVLEGSYDITKAPDGATALSLVRSSPPVDVVLTDVRLPGASGFEVLRAVRESAPATAVVMMTAYANVIDAVAAIQLGAFDYVSKPLDADEIALVVARAVEHARGASPARGASARRAGGGVPEEAVWVGYHRAVEEARTRASREYLVRLMGLHHGNVTRAARSAGLTRESLHRVLRKYGVRSEDHKDRSEDPGGPAAPDAADGGD